MPRHTERAVRALEIFISRNEELQRHLDNFHVHPGGLFIRERRDDYAWNAFASAAQDRSTTVEDYILMIIARSPAELEQLRAQRRQAMAVGRRESCLEAS